MNEQFETILAVDDAGIVLNVVVEVLRSAHFHVLQASSGHEAVEVAANHTGRIDLLLSDIEMPGMTGPELGDILKALRPKMHVMFMSGFSGGRLLVLNYGWAFIDKPFVSSKLIEMINSVLHSPDKSQGLHQYDSRKEAGKEE
jgi:two-component system cell cycle sensor histidine kinase/response regulator CckA